MKHNLLKTNYENACNAYRDALMNQWDMLTEDGWWVGDKVGTVWFFAGGEQCISMDELVYCVENLVEYETFLDCVDYSLKCLEFNLTPLNLEAFCEGAPRHPESLFVRLNACKEEMETLIEDAKQNEKDGKI